ncbi:MAG: MFS transporter [Nitriliruptorales bacterium]|nr:MFS transporter [Nitriliruptorales bacterium]
MDAAPDPTTSDAEPSRLAAIRELMQLPAFRRLLIVRWSSQFADGLFQVGSIGLLLFALDPFAQTSATDIAEVIAITALPFTIVGPVAGVFIDRWRRRRILAGAALTRVVLIAATLPLVSAHLLGLSTGETIYYVAVLVALGINRFQLATLGAILPRLVPTEVLLPANAISSTGGSLVVLSGATVGGLLAGLIGDTNGGPEIVVAISEVFLVVSALAALRFVSSELGPDADEVATGTTVADAYRDVVAGARDITRARRAWAPMVTFATLRFSTVGASIAALLVIRNEFGGGSTDVGFFLASFGVGVGVGAVAGSLLDRLTDVRQETMVRVGTLATGLVIIAVGPILTTASLLTLSGLMGLGFGVTKVATDTLVQTGLPDAMRGRLFAAFDVIVNLFVVAAGVTVALLLTDVSRSDDLMLGLGALLALLPIVGRNWLRRLPPAVDVETWEEARHLH